MSNIIGCGCSGDTQNTGYLSQKLFNIKTSMYIVPILAADGTRNGLDLTAPDLGAALLAKVNHADPTKRFYPIHEIKNFVPEQEDAAMATTNGGENFKLRDGIKSETWELWGASAQFYGKIKGFCYEWGVVEVDNCGNIRGLKDTATSTDLYPRPVNVQSWDAKYMDADDSNVARIMVRLEYKRGDNHAKLWLLPSNLFGTNNPLQLKGLVDVLITALPLTDTTIQLDVVGTFGTATTLIPINGLVVGNVTTLNTTDNAAVTNSTLVASATIAGRYVLTIAAAQTTADLLKISVFKAATGALTQGFEGSVSGVVSI